MFSHLKKLSLIMVTLFVTLFAVFSLLQFAEASTAGVPLTNDTIPAAQEDASPLTQWLIVANGTQSNMRVVNAATDVVYGPFLQDQLGSAVSMNDIRLDVAVTPDGKTALISSFGDSAVFLVDISNPISPSLITSVTVPFFAEDIDISADGKYALIADGGFSPFLASINIPAATLVYTAELGTASAQGVSVAPDGTVIFPDYFGQSIHTTLLDATGAITYANPITYANTYTYTYPGYAITDTSHMPHPVNVGLAPDGQTVIVCSAFTSTVGVYRIVSPGILTFTGVITGLHGDFLEHESFSPNVQSVAFNSAGTQAYAVINNLVANDITGTQSGDRLAVLNITAPGEVSLTAGGVVTLPHKTGSAFFGVDTVAATNNKVYVGYQTFNSNDTLYPLAIVDLADYSVASTMVLSPEISIPTGLAVVPVHETYLPVILQ